MLKTYWLITAALTIFSAKLSAQTDLITDIPARHALSLNGKWQYIIDPYGTGFYDYRYKEQSVKDREAYLSVFDFS